MVEVKDGTFHFGLCGKGVAVKEKPGERDKAQRPRILIGECGHVVAERPDEYSPWEIAS